MSAPKFDDAARGRVEYILSGEEKRAEAILRDAPLLENPKLARETAAVISQRCRDLRALLASHDDLAAEVERLRRACAAEELDIQQTLGKALRYPWFKDDPKNFPGATEKDGVCVGGHVAASLADEAAKRIESLAAEVERLRGGPTELRTCSCGWGFEAPVGVRAKCHWCEPEGAGRLLESCWKRGRSHRAFRCGDAGNVCGHCGETFQER